MSNPTPSVCFVRLNPGGDAGKARIALMVGAARRRLVSQLVKEKLA